VVFAYFGPGAESAGVFARCGSLPCTPVLTLGLVLYLFILFACPLLLEFSTIADAGTCANVAVGSNDLALSASVDDAPAFARWASPDEHTRRDVRQGALGSALIALRTAALAAFPATYFRPGAQCAVAVACLGANLSSTPVLTLGQIVHWFLRQLSHAAALRASFAWISCLCTFPFADILPFALLVLV